MYVFNVLAGILAWPINYLVQRATEGRYLPLLLALFGLIATWAGMVRLLQALRDISEHAHPNGPQFFGLFLPLIFLGILGILIGYVLMCAFFQALRLWVAKIQTQRLGEEWGQEQRRRRKLQRWKRRLKSWFRR